MRASLVPLVSTLSFTNTSVRSPVYSIRKSLQKRIDSRRRHGDCEDWAASGDEDPEFISVVRIRRPLAIGSLNVLNAGYAANDVDLFASGYLGRCRCGRQRVRAGRVEIRGGHPNQVAPGRQKCLYRRVGRRVGFIVVVGDQTAFEVMEKNGGTEVQVSIERCGQFEDVGAISADRG